MNPVAKAPDDSGSIMPLFPVIVMVLLLLGGLLVDGSRDFQIRGRTQAYAEEAARAGATAVNLASDELALDQAQARARVAAYCTAVMSSDHTVQVCGLSPTPFTKATTCEGLEVTIVVNVKVQSIIHTSLLGIVGVSDLGATGEAQARPYEGTSPDTAC